EKDGLQNCDFNLRAIKTMDDGTIVAGGLYGLNVFNPDYIRYNEMLPKVMFSNLSLFDEPVEVGRRYDHNLILPEELDKVRKIVLDHKQNIFTVELATDNYILPSKTQYLYRLDELGDEWLSLAAGTNRITFTNLSHGSYTLSVRAINSDGFQGTDVAQLSIIVRPPFWLSWWAYLCYSLVVVVALWFARRLLLKREREKFHIQQMEQEAAKNEEVNQMKFRFFTNISHELRTPLTLIISPLEELLVKESDEARKTVLQLMYRNARRLLALVNQLLDFRKGEMSGHQLSLSEGDIVSYIREICNSFLLMADNKHIQFSFFSGVECFPMAFDADKVGKIVMNLLSNAFKYTPDGGRVTVMMEYIEEENEWMEIKVSDTGIGIPDADKQHIFERFYQVAHKGMEETTGNGIGLSLVHDFVQLHGGSVEVFDNIGAGTVFVVRLPVRHVDVAAVLPEPLVVLPESEKTTEAMAEQTSRKEFPLLLVVDDNADFRMFMQHSLELQYRVKLASDGEEAWNMMQDELPDLVISDVMMPVMDGIELCRRIKADKRTAYIPVILLTARQAVEATVKGLEIGADDYVTKPFNMMVLVLRIRKLIEQSRYRHATHAVIDPTPSDIVITSLDEKLIEKAIKYVEDNISRSNFSVEELSRGLGMSRVHLYKKLLQITGKTPIEFIRVIRLKRAAQLLRESQLHVSEVAYEVGFNSPRYFSRYFKEEFGMLPSEYQEKGGINKSF
ncbi:hybrid sensor histidine kinase/response regulator transcription factor, partial [Bacteroides gallinaceum]|uniref:hybrid sensor histidine kinase/response regulator transcription factor n=1 Tax=Bacteroides gallinaceum TaxID=1462571 RepID=UPI0025AB323C